MVEARNASSASIRVSTGHERSCAPDSSITTLRVIEARMCSSSGGVNTASPSTQKIELVGASRTRPWGVTISASS